ncbi:hypothetical protein A6048_16590 [Dietzia psychralcaliphila]|uniref:Uncharacterized protein n=1 Tax=Dietzia psychralcaliphila TaxID=139021 RepID=A0AAD0NR54_9ACTN|nr:hypothetical protein A6048_16590 [Dietzia psychralcaliphila]
MPAGTPVGVCEVPGTEVGADDGARVVDVRAVVGRVVTGRVVSGRVAVSRVDVDRVGVSCRGPDGSADQSEVRQVTRYSRAIHAGAPIAIASSGQVMV